MGRLQPGRKPTRKPKRKRDGYGRRGGGLGGPAFVPWPRWPRSPSCRATRRAGHVRQRALVRADRAVAEPGRQAGTARSAGPGRRSRIGGSDRAVPRPRPAGDRDGRAAASGGVVGFVRRGAHAGPGDPGARVRGSEVTSARGRPPRRRPGHVRRGGAQAPGSCWADPAAAADPTPAADPPDDTPQSGGTCARAAHPVAPLIISFLELIQAQDDEVGPSVVRLLDIVQRRREPAAAAWSATSCCQPDRVCGIGSPGLAPVTVPELARDAVQDVCPAAARLGEALQSLGGRGRPGRAG